MQASRAVPRSIQLVASTKPLIGAIAAALLACSHAYAASFGHSRIVSSLGQPLHINVQVSQLSAADEQSFLAMPAPASAWMHAGLLPPVDLASLQLELVDGYAPGTKLIQIRSSETFNKPVADLLLDIRTASGQQRYQVSLLTHARPEDVVAPALAADSASNAGGAEKAHAAGARILVKRGDNMFAIARRNAVQGVTVYQMMIALQRANPHAFIHDNLNLVKAGATLTMPDRAELTAISDREARRLFHLQVQAFAQYRQRAAAGAGAAEVAGAGAASGQVTSGAQVATPQSTGAQQDQLRLSGANTNSDGNQTGRAGGSTGTGDGGVQADDATATRKGISESEQRVSQLEENVKTLNKALNSQGAAASDLVLDGAKGLSQSLSDVADAVTAAGSGQPDSAATQDAGATGTSSNGQVTEHDAAGGNAASVDGGPAGSGPQDHTNAPTSGQPAPDSSSVSDTASSTQGASEQGDAAQTGSQGDSSQGSSSQSGSSAKGALSGGQDPSVGSSTSPGGPSDIAQDSQSSPPVKQAGEEAESNSTKAEEPVSWFQEHMLGVITGALALIVLIIAWLLRRANTTRDEGRKGHTGPITEAMVQEKLDQINLDLEEQQPSRPPRDAR